MHKTRHHLQTRFNNQPNRPVNGYSGYMGSPARWRTMPWMVAFFGILVIPLGLTHIILVISQPMLVHHWCLMCLLAAGITLPMIPLEVDEVVAMSQHMVEARRRGDRDGSLWRIFWFGGTADGCAKDDEVPDLSEFPQKPWAVFKASIRGMTFPWTLIVSTLLGLGLMFCPRFFGISIHSVAADIGHAGGAMIVTVSVICMGEVVRIGRYLNVVSGTVVASVPWVLSGTASSYAITCCVIGIAIVLPQFLAALSVKPTGCGTHMSGEVSMFDFVSNTIWMNALIFAVGASLVWYAGTKLSAYVDLFADRTGLGKAFAGALLLGGATSLPELATTLTAASSGAAKLAGTNLLGGVVMQIAVLAVVDALVLRGKALTFFSPRSSLLLLGVMLIGLTALASAAVSSRELFSVGHVGLWPVVLFAAYLSSLWVIHKYEGDSRWEPRGEIAEPPESARDLKDAQVLKYQDTATRLLAGYFVVACAGVLVGGYFVARTGEAIAEQSGLGQNLVGATLVALATSLPEVSTTWGAVRFGAYSMAAANILGTNSMEIALFLPADIAYRDGLIFDALEPSAGFLAAIGIVVTSLYLWGILERRDRTVFGMGRDSVAVLIVYVAGMTVYSIL